MNRSEELLSLIDKSPTVFHTCEVIGNRLKENGYVQLKEEETWDIRPGENYYVIRNHSSLLAFQIPTDTERLHLQMCASHIDSPMFKLKPEGQMTGNGCIRWNVEIYGGPVLSTWLDRPLSVAGRVFVKNGPKIESVLVNIDKDFAIIPNTAPHLNRNLNEGYKYNAQVDMMPVFGCEGQNDILFEEIEKACGVKKEDIAGYDLYLYNHQKGTIWADGQLISAPRLDDIQCAYAGIAGLLEAKAESHINMMCCFDNEEVGSTTRQGAHSDFLINTITRILRSLGKADETEEIISRSFMVSADNAQAVHPNHPELTDATTKAYVNGGITIKMNANQSYTTDGFSNAVFQAICEKCNVPYQQYVNRSDLRGGRTLGNISNSNVSVNSVDIGLPQWAMHSCYETAGCKDTEDAVTALTCYFNTDIDIVGNIAELK
ncbi:MAG: M18 family aminopeptidase [Erysipelotrichaceae bacterium]|nr:M18 family aminopeptidase [Erysipelotrichaceae bacterium]